MTTALDALYIIGFILAPFTVAGFLAKRWDAKHPDAE